MALKTIVCLTSWQKKLPQKNDPDRRLWYNILGSLSVPYWVWFWWSLARDHRRQVVVFVFEHNIALILLCFLKLKKKTGTNPKAMVVFEPNGRVFLDPWLVIITEVWLLEWKAYPIRLTHPPLGVYIKWFMPGQVSGIFKYKVKIDPNDLKCVRACMAFKKQIPNVGKTKTAQKWPRLSSSV